MNTMERKELRIFDAAAHAFSQLEKKAIYEGHADIREAQEHIPVALLAIAKLYSLSRSTLCELEKKGVVHRSTVSGNSLDSAFHALRHYLLDQQTMFNRDHYEQIKRACYSAKDFYDSLKREHLSFSSS